MKQLSMVLSSLSLCVLLLCAILLLLPAQPFSAASTEGKAEKTKNLFCYAPEQLDTIRFSSQEQSFTLVNLGTHFAIEGFSTIPLEESRISSLLSLLEQFPAGEPSSLSLENPCRIEITPVNEETFLLFAQPKDNFCLISDGTVCYQLPLEQAEPLFWSAEDYVDTTISSFSPPNGEGSLLISGKLHPKPLHFSFHIEGRQVSAELLSPFEESLPPEKMENILDSLFSLKAEEVVVLSPSDAQIQDAGLSDPFCTIDFNAGDCSFSLFCSQAQEDGCVFLMKEGLPLIYRVDLTSIPWYSACLETLTDVSLFSPQYEDTTCLNVWTAEKQYRFTKWDGQVLCGNKSIDENQFFHFYKTASDLIPTEAALFPPKDTTPILTLSFSYTNPAKKEDIIQFFPYDESRVYLSINGETKFLTAYSSVETILNQCQQLLNQP